MRTGAQVFGSQRGPKTRNAVIGKTVNLTTAGGATLNNYMLSGIRTQALNRLGRTVSAFIQGSGSSGGMPGKLNNCYGTFPDWPEGGAGANGAYAYILNATMSSISSVTIYVGQPGTLSDYASISSTTQEQGYNFGGATGGLRATIPAWSGGSGGGRGEASYIAGLSGGTIYAVTGGPGGGGGYSLRRSYTEPLANGTPGSVPSYSSSTATHGDCGSGGAVFGQICYGYSTTRWVPSVRAPSPITTSTSAIYSTTTTNGSVNGYAPPSPTNSPWGAVSTSSPGAGGAGQAQRAYASGRTPISSTNGLTGRITVVFTRVKL